MSKKVRTPGSRVGECESFSFAPLFASWSGLALWYVCNIVVTISYTFLLACLDSMIYSLVVGCDVALTRMNRILLVNWKGNRS